MQVNLYIATVPYEHIALMNKGGGRGRGELGAAREGGEENEKPHHLLPSLGTNDY